MKLYYKLKETQIIEYFKFWQLTQLSNEMFSAFCNLVEAAKLKITQ